MKKIEFMIFPLCIWRGLVEHFFAWIIYHEIYINIVLLLELSF